MPFALLVTGLIVGGLVLLLVLNTFSAANELRRHALASRDASVAAQVEQLQIEVADSAAPAKLAAAALALGMVPAGNPAFLVIGKDGSVRVMGSAAPASPAVVDLPTPPAAPKSSTRPAKDKTTKAKTAKHAGKKKATRQDAGKKKGGTKGRPSTKSDKTKAKHAAATKHHPAGRKTRTPPPASPTPTPTVTLPGGDR